MADVYHCLRGRRTGLPVYGQSSAMRQKNVYQPESSTYRARKVLWITGFHVLDIGF